MIKVVEAWTKILESNAEIASQISLFAAPFIVFMSGLYVKTQEQQKNALKGEIETLKTELDLRPTPDKVKAQSDLIKNWEAEAEEYKRQLQEEREKLETVLSEKEDFEIKAEISGLIEKLETMEQKVATKISNADAMVTSQPDRLDAAWEKTFGTPSRSRKYTPQWFNRLLRR